MNINAKFRANFYRVIIWVSRRIILFVGYLKIAVVHPLNSNIIEGHPSLVLAQKVITLIQLFFYSKYIRIEIELSSIILLHMKNW